MRIKHFQFTRMKWFKKGHKEANEADPDSEHDDLDIDIEDEDDIHSI